MTRKLISGGGSKSHALALAFFLVLLLCLMRSEVQSNEESPGEDRPAQMKVYTITIPITEVKDLPKWQQSPMGEGEFAPFPGTPLERARFDGRLFVGTDLGLLCSEGSDEWRIVPDAYGSIVRPVGEVDGVLWVQKGEFTDKGQQYTMLALNPDDYSLAREVPGVARTCISADSKAFFTLASSRGERIVEFDLTGAEKRASRFFGDLKWYSVDHDAVWLCTERIDSGKEAPHDYYLERIDRKTWKATTIDMPSRTNLEVPIGDDSGEIYWRWAGGLVRYDKRTGKFEQFGGFRTGLEKSHTPITDGYRIWFHTEPDDERLKRSPWSYHFKTCAIDVSTLKPLDPEHSGDPTPRCDTPYWMPERMRGTLQESFTQLCTCTSESIWFIDRDLRLVEMRDDGRCFVRDLSPYITTRTRTFITSNQDAVYVAGGCSFIRIQPGSEKASLMGIDNPGDCILYLAATDSRVWLCRGQSRNRTTQKPLFMCISPDLSGMRRLSIPGRYQVDACCTIHSGDDMYLWRYSEHILYRLDGATGKTTPLKSHHLDGIENYDLTGSVALNDGRILVHMTPRKNAILYDPEKDKWQGVALDRVFKPVRLGKKLYGISGAQIGRCDDLSWKPVGDLTLSNDQQWPWLLRKSRTPRTERYLYIQTPMGLLRREWPKE